MNNIMIKKKQFKMSALLHKSEGCAICDLLLVQIPQVDGAYYNKVIKTPP